MASEKPLLSIIVCMNGPNPYMGRAFGTLAKAVDGLPVETILVANGGYVPDVSITQRFHQYLSTSIGGLGWARNRGVEQALGRYVSFFDADDVIERAYVDAILEAIAQGRIRDDSYAYGGTRNIGPEDEPIGPSWSSRMTRAPNRTLWCKHPFTGATLVISRDSFFRAGGYKWSGYAEDYEFSIRLRERFGEALYMGDNRYVYRLHGNAMSSSTRAKARGVLQIQVNAFLAGRGLRYAAGALVSVGRLCAAALRGK